MAKRSKGGKPARIQRIDREITGAADEIDGRTIQPVARIRGFIGNWESEAGRAEFARLRLEPQAAVIEEAGGKTRRLRLDQSPRPGLTAMLLLAVALTALLWWLGWRLT
jgi:hypothetical protein